MPKPGRAQPARDDQASTPWRALVRITGLVRRVGEPHFARYGVSGAQWGVLRSLARLEARGQGEPRMNELGDELLVHPPSLSATIDRMVRAGLVTRREDVSDQRTRRIGLTRLGRSRLAAAMPSHNEWVEGMMAALNSTERAMLGTLLERLSNHLTHVLADADPEAARGKAAKSDFITARRSTRARRAS